MGNHNHSVRARTRALIGFMSCVFIFTATATHNGYVWANPGDFTSLNTNKCPFKHSPPAPIDQSEVPRDGKIPEPLPVHSPTVGGESLSECGIIQPEGEPHVPDNITATSWLLADLDTGQVLAAKDPHGRYRPASTIKLLLAYTVAKKLPLHSIVQGQKSDEQVEGDHLGIVEGARYTVETLLKGLLLISGNDAAEALARALGGRKKALAMMNANARHLQAFDTRAASPSGLDGPGMSVSAYDEALILRADLQIPVLRRILASPTGFFPGYKNIPGYTYEGQNYFVTRHKGGIGGKTGFTDDAEKTYVGAVRRGNRNMIVVQLYGYSVGENTYWNQAERLLQWGSHLKSDSAVGTLVSPQVPSRSHITPRLHNRLTSSLGNEFPWKSIAILGVMFLLFIVLSLLIYKKRKEVYVAPASRKLSPPRPEVPTKARSRVRTPQASASLHTSSPPSPKASTLASAGVAAHGSRRIKSSQVSGHTSTHKHNRTTESASVPTHSGVSSREKKSSSNTRTSAKNNRKYVVPDPRSKERTPRPSSSHTTHIQPKSKRNVTSEHHSKGTHINPNQSSTHVPQARLRKSHRNNDDFRWIDDSHTSQ